MRNQFCQFVDLPIRHLQHAADVAQHAARLQRTEGDDLGDLVAAVALLHIGDHLAAPVLAEVDVEVRHRHPLRIEEALEQQAKADRIEIGDGQRPGDQRACAGAAPRSHRNALRLRPFDEVGHDQKVARIFHAGDDIELEGKALAVLFVRRALRHAVHAQALGQPLLGLPLQLRRFDRGRIGAGRGTDGEIRQDRLARHRPERAALGDLDALSERLGNVGEQHRHFRTRLEAVVGRQLVALGLGDQPPAGNTKQRVMRLIIVIAGEIRLVGRNQRQALGIGKVNQPALDAALAVHAMPLQLDIEAVAEHLCQPLAAHRRQFRVAGTERRRNRSVRPTCQCNDVVGVAIKPFELDVRRLMHRRFQEGARIEPHQAAVAALAGRKQHDARRDLRMRIARIGVLVAEIDGKFQADDRLDAVARHLVGEFQRPEHVVGVGQRQRRLLVGFRKFAELGDLDRALQQRIGGMDVEMDESGIGH
ncbi:hypothetical protein ES707_14873 [subsurface metagenome]